MDNSSDEEQHGQSKGNTTFVEPAGVTTFQHRKHVQVRNFNLLNFQVQHRTA